MYEVEMKFPVQDEETFKRHMEENYNVVWGEIRIESDLFFQHVQRDFRKTDECLRIRRCGQELYLTYKGPKLDTTTKTREEIELPLYEALVTNKEISNNTEQVESVEDRLWRWTLLWGRLGFSPCANLTKQRREAKFYLNDREVLITLDKIEGVGVFTELELIVPEVSEIDEARSLLMDFAEKKQLGKGIRKSYLRLATEAQINQSKCN